MSESDLREQAAECERMGWEAAAEQKREQADAMASSESVSAELVGRTSEVRDLLDRIDACEELGWGAAADAKRDDLAELAGTSDRPTIEAALERRRAEVREYVR